MDEFQRRMTEVVLGAPGIPASLRALWYEPLSVRFEGDDAAPVVVKFEPGFPQAFAAIDTQTQSFVESNLRTQLRRYDPKKKAAKALLINMPIEVLRA